MNSWFEAIGIHFEPDRVVVTNFTTWLIMCLLVGMGIGSIIFAVIL